MNGETKRSEALFRAVVCPARPRLALNLTECQGGHTRKHMPTYEYACSACGNEWEQTQRITEPPVEMCPKCAKAMAHRLISAGTNFILKGGGWYSDLYASPKAAEKPENTKEKTEKSGASDAASPQASGTEAAGKGATKPASTEGSSSASSASPSPSTPPSSASSS
jgi:putative FmdB family regulatory protein